MVNLWVEHVRKYAKDNNMTYGCAISYASKTYTKKNNTSKSTIPNSAKPKQETHKPENEKHTKANNPEDSLKVITDRDAYELLFKSLGITSKNIKREIIFDIDDLIKRYGEGGHGDKPKNMNKITYWAQHLDLTKYIK